MFDGGHGPRLEKLVLARIDSFVSLRQSQAFRGTRVASQDGGLLAVQDR